MNYVKSNNLNFEILKIFTNNEQRFNNEKICVYGKNSIQACEACVNFS